MNTFELAKSMAEPIRCGGMEYFNGIAHLHIGGRTIPYDLIEIANRYNCFGLLCDLINILDIYRKV